MEIKEKVINAGSMISGSASILGSYQLCHSLCLSAIALLSIIGITVTGMPLLFLTKVAVPFWIAGFSLLVLMIVLAQYNILHFSNKLMLANLGLLTAGVPFERLAQFQKFFWIAGILLVVASISWAFAGRKNKSCCVSESKVTLKRRTKK